MYELRASRPIACIGPAMLLAVVANWTGTAALAAPTVSAVVNAASYQAALAPGTWAAIFGTELATSTTQASAVPLPGQLGGVSVTVGGVAAPLLFVSPGQINVLIPFEMQVANSVPVVVKTAAGVSGPVKIALGVAAPAIFTVNSQGRGNALAFDANFRPLANVNGTLMFYAAGLGPTNPAPVSSAAGGSTAEPLNRITSELTVLIGEARAQVTFAGLAPGLPGIYQVNVIPPANPKSNRLCLFMDGVYSNSVTLPIPVGKNVVNVIGSIDGAYPASGRYRELFGVAGDSASTSGPVRVSQLLTAAGWSFAFDIAPGAAPFRIVGTTPSGDAVIEIDPANKSWRATLPAPLPRVRIGDFNNTDRVVYDLSNRRPFPGNIVPISLLDPMAHRAAENIPYPTDVIAISANGDGAANASWIGFGSLPENGHIVVEAREPGELPIPQVFGGYLDLGHQPPATQTAQFLLIIDGMLVDAKNVTYAIRQ